MSPSMYTQIHQNKCTANDHEFTAMPDRENCLNLSISKFQKVNDS